MSNVDGGSASTDHFPGLKEADFASVEKRVIAHYGFDPVADIAAFHEKFKLEYVGKPRSLDTELAEFRIGFLIEELKEYEESSEKLRAILKVGYPNFTHEYLRNTATWELEKQLDALVDLVYVALGTAYLHGFDFREAWRRVHAANMAKVRAERKEDSKRGSTFDVVKPEGWTPPSHTDLVADHAHKR